MSENLEKDGTSSTLRGEGKIEATMIGEGDLEVSSIFHFILVIGVLPYASGGMDWGREPRPGPPMGFGGGGGFRGGRGPPMGGFGGGGPDFRGRDRFSPERGRRHEMSPPPKRMRGGWEEDGYGGGGRGGGGYDGGYDREERWVTSCGLNNVDL